MSVNLNRVGKIANAGILLALLLVSSVLVLYARRRDLPIIGKTF